MTGEFSVFDLIWNASLVVQLVLLALLLASIASWAVIIEKRKLLNRADSDADEFETNFWSGIDLNKYYQQIAEAGASANGMAGIFRSGYKEFGRLREEAQMSVGALVQGAHRAMNVSQMREVDRLEQNLAFLATVASTSPYVGLFGTVWGIMSAFYSLQGAQSVTIALVAGPISEALIATAMGLFAAIPAQIAYNRYADMVDRLEVRYDTFREELASLLERSAARRARSAAGTSAEGAAGAGG